MLWAQQGHRNETPHDSPLSAPHLRFDEEKRRCTLCASSSSLDAATMAVGRPSISSTANVGPATWKKESNTRGETVCNPCRRSAAGCANHQSCLRMRHRRPTARTAGRGGRVDAGPCSLTGEHCEGLVPVQSLEDNLRHVAAGANLYGGRVEGERLSARCLCRRLRVLSVGACNVAALGRALRPNRKANRADSVSVLCARCNRVPRAPCSARASASLAE